MNRFVFPLIAFALLAVVLAVGIRRAPEKGQIESPLIGRPAPAFDLPSLTEPGRNVRSQDLAGRWYVLNIWGTWCVGCRIEHDVLLELARTAGVPIIGLNWKDDRAQALEWLSQLGNPYEAIAMDEDGRAAIDWGAYGAPETFLVDPQGIVVHKHIGPLTLEAWRRDFAPRIERTAQVRP